jgi:hypothetical protein
LIATSGALTLLTNCVMAWNTQRPQRAVERESQRTAPRLSISNFSVTSQLLTEALKGVELITASL